MCPFDPLYKLNSVFEQLLIVYIVVHKQLDTLIENAKVILNPF